MVLMAAADCVFERNEFVSNFAWGNGGGIFISVGQNLFLTETRGESNRCDGMGGFLFFHLLVNMTVLNSVIIDNYAPYVGQQAAGGGWVGAMGARKKGMGGVRGKQRRGKMGRQCSQGKARRSHGDRYW